VKLESAHGSIDLPAYIWPGVKEGVAAVQMGLGHQGFGRYTQGRGANPMRLLGGQLDAEGGMASATRVRASKSAGLPGRFSQLDSGLFEQGVRIQHDRAIAQAVSWKSLFDMNGRGAVIPGADHEVEELRTGGGFGPAGDTSDPKSFPRAGTEYGQYHAGNVRWGMTVDLARCIGCAACVVACNAENNIPVVGHREMKRGRELSWLRIERYFDPGRDEAAAFADTATDDVRFLPMLCQHCGNAPCEPVCPVYAAYHTPEGLNGQVYNRCVGTRYCANNCPYKVRVFNWFTYEFASPLHLQLNPDVTVREKGVMEKCTFCVQRIHETERRASMENRHVRDGEVTPACAQACPTQVFTFGNFQDPQSAVSRAARTNRSFQALGELNTQPGIVYLKKVTLHEPSNGGHAEERPAPFGGDEHTPQGGVAPAPHGGGR
jgi:Fe-S-cluster-containing dehydrogenase component